MTTGPDRWSEWLLQRRDGGSESQHAATLDRLLGIRDRVLDAAEPLDGLTVLDVGTGDGLIGFAALQRVGPRGTVVFSDVSEPLLAECQRVVDGRGGGDAARFVVANAEDLAPIDDGSVDVVTTRSVLIYVVDKAAAFAAFRRVLRPGGRISLFEPINRLMYPEPAGRFWGYDVSAATDLAEKVKAPFLTVGGDRWREAMLGFDDRDLVDLALQAGFEHVHVECHIDIEPGSLRSVSLEALLDSAPNPNAPTVREAIGATLTDAEQVRFLAHLGHAFIRDDPVQRLAVTYLVAS